MTPDILSPGLNVIFVQTVWTELETTLGFPHLHPRDRFWELLKIGGITPERIIAAADAKALVEGHRTGNLTEPVRLLFIEKKTGQLLRRGIGLTVLNRRVVAASEKDAPARPTLNDIHAFVDSIAHLSPRILAFVTPPDLFVSALRPVCTGVTGTLGRQPCNVGGAETWFLGSTISRGRGDALTQQEDMFFALGERIEELGATNESTGRQE